MRAFLLTLSAIGLLLVPACNFRTDTSEAEVVPAATTPIPNSPPVTETREVAEPLEPAADSSPSGQAFAYDPAPAPPAESTSFAPEEPTAKPSSAEDVLQSVARVLQGAAAGSDDETGTDAKGSVFGSIGRALSKGFQEAVAGDHASENASENSLDE